MEVLWDGPPPRATMVRVTAETEGAGVASVCMGGAAVSDEVHADTIASFSQERFVQLEVVRDDVPEGDPAAVVCAVFEEADSVHEVSGMGDDGGHVFEAAHEGVKFVVC